MLRILWGTARLKKGVWSGKIIYFIFKLGKRCAYVGSGGSKRTVDAERYSA
jgi:hypothetical protein